MVRADAIHITGGGGGQPMWGGEMGRLVDDDMYPVYSWTLSSKHLVDEGRTGDFVHAQCPPHLG